MITPASRQQQSRDAGEGYDFHRIESRWQRVWEEQGTFACPDVSDRPKYYALEMFPSLSGAGLHGGHVRNYVPADAFCRYMSMNGYQVLHPTGWDAFGRPVENEALRQHRNPWAMVPEYVARFRRTMRRLGLSYDWDREINTSDPAYYKWTQWLFLLFYERGLAYRAATPGAWCPSCRTGIANEEVAAGRCWRCDAATEARFVPQWYLRMSTYAARLDDDLNALDWPDDIKRLQHEWIGRTEGVEIDFPVIGSREIIRAFTRYPADVFGTTFLLLSPDSRLPARTRVPACRSGPEEANTISAAEQDGAVFTGTYVLNPASRKQIPVWLSRHRADESGGAQMGVPAHEPHHLSLARQLGLPVRTVYSRVRGDRIPGTGGCPLPREGILRDAGRFTGSSCSAQTDACIATWMRDTGVGRPSTRYRLQDWLVSRQRYWGAPIPIVHCSACGEVPVPAPELPVRLPEAGGYGQGDAAEPLLHKMPGFVDVTCPACHRQASRETDTLSDFACSSWYFLRFCDPHDGIEFASRNALDRWLPVDLYTGGREHAVLHLLYARFWTKVLCDAGLVPFDEPFRALRNQGVMKAYTPGRCRRRGKPDQQDSEWVPLRPEEVVDTPQDQIVWRWWRMSKSKGNGVDVDDLIDRYGADCLRVCVLRAAAFADDMHWQTREMRQASRFLARVWEWANSVLPSYDPNWRQHVRGDGQSSHEGVCSLALEAAVSTVSGAIKRLEFNVAIEALEELLNVLCRFSASRRPIPRTDLSVELSEALETFVLMVSPFAPYLVDELWAGMGHTSSTYRARWPGAASPE